MKNATEQSKSALPEKDHTPGTAQRRFEAIPSLTEEVSVAHSDNAKVIINPEMNEYRKS